MPELKTIPTENNVREYLHSIEDVEKREDCLKILELMKAATGHAPVLWGDSIVGFGNYKYKYASGRAASWFLTGFAARKQNITLYIMSGFEQYTQLLSALGKHKTGKSCLYIRKLEDIDFPTLKKLIELSVLHMKNSNPEGNRD